MKKWIVLLVCLLALGLCACEKDTDKNTEPPETQNKTEAPKTETADPKALAESCIGKSVQELYALIGEPETSAYVASCLGDGTDGNLEYTDFIVYTYREGNTETVTAVE